MEIKIKSFSEQEKLFREKTGKDFSTLYTKYYPKLIYFTSRMCNDVQKAEDISTDSFMIALDKIEKSDFESQQLADFESQYQWFLGLGFLLLLADIFLLEKKTNWVQKLNLFNEKKHE